MRKYVGDGIGKLGRWYIALPPLLLLGFLVGMFLIAIAGQARLAAATDRVRDSHEREQALNEYVALISGAETAQRGYLLTAENAYLAPYESAVAAITPALGRVQRAYATGVRGAAQTAELATLTARKRTELAATVRAFEARHERPFEATEIDAGHATTDEIQALVAAMRGAETTELAAATASWRRDLLWSRWFIVIGISLNVWLLLITMRRVYGDMRRRAQQATDLRDRSQELERQVAERTRDLTSLSTHLQEVSEQEKAALSRELHDELGGLLVAARMDLSWLQQRLPTNNPAIEQRFKRIHDSLSAGVDLKRRVVEELRPTLLDNMGLFAALRWQFKETCRRSGLECTESFPDDEPKLDPLAAIAIFRVAQEALTNVLKHAGAATANLTVEIDGESFSLRVSDDGKGITQARLQAIASHGLASMRHRIVALGGNWQLTSPASGGTTVTAVIPLGRILAPEPAVPESQGL
jgi:signal transduction histidine kinase